MKPLYINGMGCISPQSTFDKADFPFVAREYLTSRLTCVEPDYGAFIDPRLSRRMGRLLKYGTTAGLMALRDAQMVIPDAISTGTGFGLLDDSGKFLKNVIEAEEGVVSPTAFIQSTHNTVSSNIALTVGCHGHNNTFAHKGFSFESALTDAQMLAGENPAMKNILVGAYDESTDYSYAIMKRLGLIRGEDTSNLELLKTEGKGTIAGEGAAFFVMSPGSTEQSYAVYRGNRILYKPNSAEAIFTALESLLEQSNLVVADIDIVISGLCGDAKRDDKLNALNHTFLSDQTILGYKHLCGEYMTSSAFALWTGAMIARTGIIPDEMILNDRNTAAKQILICSAYKDDYTLILLSAP